MNDEQTEFLSAEGESFNMRGQQVNQKEPAEQVTTRPDRDFETGPGRSPENKQAVEITLLRHIKPQMYLRKSSCEDEDQRASQAENSQPQRREYIQNTLKKHWDIGLIE